MKKSVRIGCGAGFSGDRLEPAVILAEKGENGSGAADTRGNPSFWADEWYYTTGVGATGSMDNSNLLGGTATGHDGDCDDSVAWAGLCTSLPRFRHTSNTNYGFADGHSKSLPIGGTKWYKNLYQESLMPAPY